MTVKPSLRVLPSLIKEYPELETLRLEGEHRGRSCSEQERAVSHVNDLPRRIPCPNPDCRGHGYYMGTILTILTRNRDTAYAGEWSCDGCTNHFSFRLWLTYTSRNRLGPRSVHGSDTSSE